MECWEMWELTVGLYRVWTIPEIPKNSLSNNSERMGSLLIIETRFPVPFPSPNYQEPFQQLGS